MNAGLVNLYGDAELASDTGRERGSPALLYGPFPLERIKEKTSKGLNEGSKEQRNERNNERTNNKETKEPMNSRGLEGAL